MESRSRTSASRTNLLCMLASVPRSLRVATMRWNSSIVVRTSGASFSQRGMPSVRTLSRALSMRFWPFSSAAACSTRCRRCASVHASA